jgi:hypothetical protein
MPDVARVRAREAAGRLILRRPLRPNERVYFKDGNPSNLSPDNLVVMPQGSARIFECGGCGAARLCYRVPRLGRCLVCRRATAELGRKRVRALLGDPAFADWSDRQIARWAGVHWSIVAPIRREVPAATRDRRKYMVGESEFVQSVGTRGRRRRVQLYCPDEGERT